MSAAKRIRSGGVIQRKGDEHLQLVIDENLSLCQTTMGIRIDEAKKIGEKAHSRVDEIRDRLFCLDNPEVGKVSKLWEDREYVQNAARDMKNNATQAVVKSLAVMIALMVASGIINYVFTQRSLASAASAPLVDKTLLKEIVKTAIKEANE